MNGGALLGRDEELGALEAALEEARGGRGRLFLLAGEPGIGKTRLADELAARAPGDVRVLWGRCSEAGGAPAYWPWVELLRPLLEESEPAALADTLAGAAAALAALMPELRRRLPGIPAGAPEDSEAARFALYDAIARFLRGVAERSPLLLVIDDLHVADRPSLRLLEFVARGLRRSRILVVGTARGADPRLGPDAASLLASVEREGQRLPLRRLREDEVAAFIAAASGASADPRVVAAVVQATEGTPLYVNEVVRLLLAQGGDARPAMSLSRLVVPDGVQPAIRGHLARISDEARAALRVAAVIGREFRFPLLEAAFERQRQDGGSAGAAPELTAALAEAERAGLVHEIDDAPARLRFGHILIRETIYKDLGAGERERLHAAVAGALESSSAATDPDRLAELAHHWGRAGGRGDRDKAVRYARAAGARALHTYAHEEAAGHFQRALDALDAEDARGARTTSDGGADHDRDRAELLLVLAEAHQRSGERVRATAACDRAAIAARRLGDAELLGRVALRRGAEFSFSFVDETLIGMLEEALAGLGEARTPLRARLMGRLAAARQPAPDPDEPLALARQALALARELDDRPTLAAVLRDARAAYMGMDDLGERMALDLETLAVAHETGDKVAAGEALRRLAAERLEQGNLSAARSHYAELDRLALELRQPHRRWLPLSGRAALAWLVGDFAEGERLLAEADALAARSEDPNVRLYAALYRLSFAAIAARPEALAQAQAAVERAIAGRGFADDRPLLVTVLAANADRDGARDALGRLPFESYGPRWLGQHHVAMLIVRAELPGPAAIMYARMLPWARQFACAMGCDGSYGRFLGLLATTMGRTVDARRHFEQAIEDNQRIGARPCVAAAELDYAELLSRTGDEAERRRAAELRARARATADELGMPGIFLRLGEPVPESPPPSVPASGAEHPREQAPAFQLEGEYWTITWGAERFRFKDSKAFQILAYLVRNPGREFHVLHLAGISAGAEGGDVLLEAAAGATPDAEARVAYGERVEDLRAELAEAEANDDLGRAARAREELDLLAEELARGVGLGGRERAAGGSAERARINIQRRIASAVRRVGEASPPLGRQLSRAIRTGSYCLYEPG